MVRADSVLQYYSSGQGYVAHNRAGPWGWATHLPTHPVAEGLGPGSGPSPEVRAFTGAAAQPKEVLWHGSITRLQPHCRDRHVMPRGRGRMGPLVTACAPAQPHQSTMAKILKQCLRCRV